MSEMEHTDSKLRKFLVNRHFALGDASDAYINRRRFQMALFFGSAAAALFSSRLTYRATITRQFVPTLFQGNHAPPTSYTFNSDAAAAVGLGTLLCGLVLLMVVTGVCWMMDVSSLAEFGWRMKTVMGGYAKQQIYAAMPMDEDTKYVQDSLVKLLNGEYDDEDEVIETEK